MRAAPLHIPSEHSLPSPETCCTHRPATYRAVATVHGQSTNRSLSPSRIQRAVATVHYLEILEEWAELQPFFARFLALVRFNLASSFSKQRVGNGVQGAIAHAYTLSPPLSCPDLLPRVRPVRLVVRRPHEPQWSPRRPARPGAPRPRRSIAWARRLLQIARSRR